MGGKRKNHTADFKARIAMDAIRGEKTNNEIASENGLHPNQVTLWKLEAIEGMKETFDKKRGRKPKDDMNDKENLLKQIGQLSIEIDWLKKKGF
jgi:transposase-like protein